MKLNTFLTVLKFKRVQDGNATIIQHVPYVHNIKIEHFRTFVRPTESGVFLSTYPNS